MDTRILNDLGIKAAAAALANESAENILRWAVQQFGRKLTMATAFGPEGCCLIHMLAEIDPDLRIFNLDTGYQFKETLEAEWIRRLKGVKSVNKVDANTWTIETNDPETVRTELKRLERENNLDIVSLQSENQSLEEVFRSLTNNPSGN